MMERQKLIWEVTNLRRQGHSIRIIAAKLGVNRGRVERALRATAQPQISKDSLGTGFDSMADTFVGYPREIQQLKARFEDTLSGRENLTMLVGEPGIGKTRTAQELARYAQGRGAQVLALSLMLDRQ